MTLPEMHTLIAHQTGHVSLVKISQLDTANSYCGPCDAHLRHVRRVIIDGLDRNEPNALRAAIRRFGTR